MSGNLLSDFTIDKTTNTVSVNRAFVAGLSQVWDAFTKQEILDRWWAPKPWTSRTKSMDFKVGGRRFYAMVSPEGQEHWSIEEYTAISPTTNFKLFFAFTDKDENINDKAPSSNWDLSFNEQNGKTSVSIVIKFKTLADLEQHIQMGFKEGFTMALNELEKLLKNLK
jgi:uncharacterized protein YndB with AHSA1/START domain